MTTRALGDSSTKKLTGNQLALLCKSIEDAISEDELPQMMVFKLEERLRNIPQANNYPMQILNLVEWAESKNKIQELVIASSLHNPTNGFLQKFVKEHFHSLAALEVSFSPGDELLMPLYTLLLEISDFSEVVLPACRLAFSDLEANAPGLRGQLGNTDLSDAVKWLILLNLFLKEWNDDNDEIPRIVLFVQNLAGLLTGSTQDGLFQWIQTLPEAFRTSSTETVSSSSQDRFLDNASNTLQVYFVVAVDTSITSNGFQFEGYLVTQFGNGGLNSKVEAVDLEMPSLQEDDGTLTGSSEELMETIQGAFPEWLVKIREVVLAEELSIKKSCGLKERPTSDVTVEFWLPDEYLSLTTENLMIYSLPVRKKKLERVLGLAYKVVMRSYDRLEDNEAFGNLKQAWNNLRTLAKDPNWSATNPEIYRVDCWNQAQLMEAQVQQSLLGIFLTCPICSSSYNQQREDLFSWMLNEGMPLILWSRETNLSEDQKADLSRNMHAWLANVNLTQLDQLYEEVFKARKELGYSLALWCDEPGRIEELVEFRKPARSRLGA